MDSRAYALTAIERLQLLADEVSAELLGPVAEATGALEPRTVETPAASSAGATGAASVELASIDDGTGPSLGKETEIRHGTTAAIARSSALQTLPIVSVSPLFAKLTRALRDFQLVKVFDRKDKAAIMRMNRMNGTYTGNSRVRVALGRAEHAPALISPLVEVTERVVRPAAAVARALLQSRSPSAFADCEALCYYVMSTLILSSSQFDTIAGLQGAALAGMYFCNAGQASAPASVTTAVSAPEPTSALEDEAVVEVIAPSDAGVDESTPLGLATQLYRHRRSSLSLPLIQSLRPVLASLSVALNDSSVSIPAGMRKNVLNTLKGGGPCLIRNMFIYAVLPWPRMHPTEWLEVVAAVDAFFQLCPSVFSHVCVQPLPAYRTMMELVASNLQFALSVNEIVGPAIAELTVLKAVGPDSGAPEVVAASAMLLSRVQSPLTDVQRTHPQYIGFLHAATLFAKSMIVRLELDVVEGLLSTLSSHPFAGFIQQQARIIRRLRDPTAFAGLSAAIQDEFDRLAPTAEEEASWERARSSVSGAVGVQLHMFGSAQSLFAIRGTCDIDLCYVAEGPGVKEKRIVEDCAQLLVSAGPLFDDITAVVYARVPIVKGTVTVPLYDADTRIDFDISVNNTLGLHNTDLLRTYAQLDSRVRPLVFLVKQWAKRRGINSAPNGTLSSYAFVNLVLFFLQTRRHQMLPNLQDCDRIAAKCPGVAFQSLTVCGFPVNYCNDVTALQRDIMPGYECRETLGQLFAEFFTFYSETLDMELETVSIRNGSSIPKALTYKDSKPWRISIEDPFETPHDLGRVVSEPGQLKITEEFSRAARMLTAEGAGNDPTVLSILLEPVGGAEVTRGPVVCFRCKQPGHVKSVCPMPSSKRKGKSATSTQSVDASAAPIEPVVSSSDPVVTVEPSVSPLAAAVVSADPLVAVEPAAIPPQSGVVASDPVDTASVILSTTDTVSAPAPVVVGIDAAVVESSTPTPATALRVPAQHPAEGGGCCCIS